MGLGLRLLAWRWHEFYPLGGDEREYLDQALRLLRDRQYVELRLMRPPLYPVFLAAAIFLVDSLVQNLRLIQALISTATIPFIYLLAREVGRRSGVPARGPALAAALLCALSYTLAANATELLTEALFLLGLTALLWLLLRAARTGRWWEAALAGLALGALCLLRSVALPLLPLGALWLWAQPRRREGSREGEALPRTLPLIFVVATLLVVAPWTARNAVAYGGLIVIDTTGAENLWLDNDPAGREAVKAQLYAMGDDRLARQRLAAQRGAAAIAGDPARFTAKAWGELTKLLALEFADDMLRRPAIWVSPGEVWARLLLGDGVWLITLLAGAYGLARAGGRGQGAGGRGQRATGLLSPAFWSDPAWLLLPWALYVALTTAIFHVELRYRLPLYPALLPYAALALAGGGRQASGARRPLARLLPPGACLLLLTLTLLHANYPALAWRLGWKHLNLAQAEASLGAGDAGAARRAAEGALARDDGSALARVALARADLMVGDEAAALGRLDAAIAALPAHPYAHLLRGDLLRRRGDAGPAAAELSYETGSLEDLQAWSWGRVVSAPPARLALGGGLDLGFIEGFHSLAAGEGGFRWTSGAARVRLTAPPGAAALRIRAASGRPDGSSTELLVTLDGRELGTLVVAAGWADYTLRLPAGVVGEAVVGLRSDTFTPRDYDRASSDGRRLGLKLGEVAIGPPAMVHRPSRGLC